MKLTKQQIEQYRNDIVKFAEDLYYLAPGKRIRLWDFQKDVLRAVTERDECGKYKHPISIISLPRQNGKSELAAILALHDLFFGSYGHQILSVAIGGRDQAKIILNKAKTAIKNSPLLYESIGDKNFLKNEITVEASDATWQIASSQYLSSLGKSIDTLILDELGNANPGLDNDYELYDALSAGMAAKPNGRVILVSTVGGTIGKFYDLIQLARHDKRVYCYMRHDNPSPLITKEYLERRKKELQSKIYSRWHENRYFSGQDSLITPAIYDAAVDPNARPVGRMPDGKFGIAWCDIGLKHDSTAIVTVYRGADNKICIAEIKTFSPKILRREIQIDEIESYLSDIKKRLNVKKIFLDEWQGAATIQRHGKRLNIEGVHLTADKLERIWSNFVGLMQNGDIKIYDDGSDDIKQMRKECLNLRITPKGASFKVTDPGKLHQDVILAFSSACWKIVEGYESEKYAIGGMDCVYRPAHLGTCPLFWPGMGFLTGGCINCSNFFNALRIVGEVDHIDLNVDRMRHLYTVEKFSVRIGGFTMGKKAVWTIAG